MNPRTSRALSYSARGSGVYGPPGGVTAPRRSLAGEKKGAHGGNLVSPVTENIVKAVQAAATKMAEGR